MPAISGKADSTITRHAAAITAEDLGRMISAAKGQGTRAVRDRAVLVLAAALRRSELVALQLADLELVKEGLKLTIRHSKTGLTSIFVRQTTLSLTKWEHVTQRAAALRWSHAAADIDRVEVQRRSPRGNRR